MTGGWTTLSFISQALRQEMTRHKTLRQGMTETTPAHAAFNQGLGFFYVIHGLLLVVGTAIHVSKHCQNIVHVMMSSIMFLGVLRCLDERSFIPNCTLCMIMLNIIKYRNREEVVFCSMWCSQTREHYDGISLTESNVGYKSSFYLICPS